MAFPVTVDGTWYGVTGNVVTLDNFELRRADAAMFAGAGGTLGVLGGIARHGDSSLAVSIDGSDSVTVKAGAVVIPGNGVAGCYRFGIGADLTGLSIASKRDATNPRIILIVAQQLDTEALSSSGGYTAQITTVDGSPGATPAAPALPSMAVELARITLPQTGGGAATVDSTYRTYATAIGGTLYVPTEARLPASAATGQKARALDTRLDYEWNGSAWLGRWHTVGTTGEPAFQNGWTAATSAQFRRDSAGNLHIRGRLNKSTSGTIAFTLPADHRPVFAYELIPVSGNGNVTGQMTINTNGEVVLFNPGTSWLTINGVISLL